MERYNYKKAVKNDVRCYVENEINLSEWKGQREELEEYLQDTLFIDDSVTGNASGSYTLNTWEAEENLCHNFDLLKEVCEEYGESITKLIEQGAKTCDVTIRCYLLNEAIAEVLNEMEAKGDLQ